MKLILKKVPDENKEYYFDCSSIAHEVSNIVQLEVAVEAFEDFLRGCGFVFDNLEIVNNKEVE